MLLEDDDLASVEYLPEGVAVRRARDVRDHLATTAGLGLGFKFALEVGHSVREVGVLPAEVGEVLHRSNRHGLDLLLEEVAFVQEEDHGSVGKGTLGADPFEQADGVHHAVLRGILEQGLVIFRECRDKEDGSHVIETMDPLFPLVPLSADIVEAKVHTVHQVLLGGNPCGPVPAVENVLLRRQVVILCELIDLVEELFDRFIHLEL
mmetsp:Transcript_2821/g.8084  ORF Transcript_2821/g.8084 Transcript_2821/m.8084 type:complete len:207 (+) Transcript_2821:504-1124(+)